MLASVAAPSSCGEVGITVPSFEDCLCNCTYGTKSPSSVMQVHVLFEEDGAGRHQEDTYGYCGLVPPDLQRNGCAIVCISTSPSIFTYAPVCRYGLCVYFGKRAVWARWVTVAGCAVWFSPENYVFLLKVSVMICRTSITSGPGCTALHSVPGWLLALSGALKDTLMQASYMT